MLVEFEVITALFCICRDSKLKNKKNKPKGEAEEAAEQAKEARKDLIKSCKKASRFEQ